MTNVMNHTTRNGNSLKLPGHTRRYILGEATADFLHQARICVIVMFVALAARGCSSMVEPLPSKQIVRVRFSSSARSSDSCSGGIRALFVSTVPRELP